MCILVTKRLKPACFYSGETKQGSIMGERLCAWVHKYLNSGTAVTTDNKAGVAVATSSSSRTTAIAAVAPSKGCTSTTGGNGASSSTCTHGARSNADGGVTTEPFLPPLYFQHEGHSRTIVG